MELVYFLIFLISFLIKDIYCVFMKKNHKNPIKEEIILFTSEEPSLLQCAQRCRFIDKNTIVDFKNAKCICLKYNDDEGQEQQGTLTGVFVNQKLMKVKETEPPQSTKPPQTRVMNVALNKIAQQSSTWSNDYVVKNAIDGDRLTSSATLEEPQPWWSIDLKTTADIMYMVLNGFIDFRHNKALIIDTRQDNSNVWITCKNIGDLQTNSFKFTCDKSTKARYVKVRSTAKAIIRFSEFEVYVAV